MKTEAASASGTSARGQKACKLTGTAKRARTSNAARQRNRQQTRHGLNGCEKANACLQPRPWRREAAAGTLAARHCWVNSFVSEKLPAPRATFWTTVTLMRDPLYDLVLVSKHSDATNNHGNANR